MRILHLTLHRKWFDAIARREKKEEYRETSRYWSVRLSGKEFDEVHFRNGYNRGCPFMRVEWKGMKTIENGPFGKCFAIQLGSILEITNWTRTTEGDLTCPHPAK